MAIKKSTPKPIEKRSSTRRRRAIEVADTTSLSIKDEITLAAPKTTKKKTVPKKAAVKKVSSTKKAAKKPVAKKSTPSKVTPKTKTAATSKAKKTTRPKRKMAASTTHITPSPKKPRTTKRLRTAAPKMSIAEAIAEEAHAAEKKLVRIEKTIIKDVVKTVQSDAFKKVIFFAEAYLFAVLIISLVVVCVSWLALVFALFIV